MARKKGPVLTCIALPQLRNGVIENHFVIPHNTISSTVYLQGEYILSGQWLSQQQWLLQ